MFQQMEKNEANPLRHGARKSIFSRLSMPKKPKECKLLAFVIFLFAIIIAGLVIIYHFHEEEFYYIYRGQNIVVNEKTLDITISNSNGKPVLFGHLWRSRPAGNLPYDCSEIDLDGRGLCLLWRRLERLEIHPSRNDNATCYDVRWLALSKEVTQSDCFELDDANWYGGGISMKFDGWPLEKSSLFKRPFVSSALHDENGFGPVLERYWLSSKGVAIVIEENSPLHVSVNSFNSILNKTDRQLCIYSDFNHATYSNAQSGVSADLSYTICIADDVQKVHAAALPLFVTKRQEGAPKALLLNPIWSTWSYFKDIYNQSMLENSVMDINRNGFHPNLVMIDDGWEEQYGDLDFVASKFHNAKDMMQFIHQHVQKVSLWTHSRLNVDSQAFRVATRKGFLLRDARGDVPGLTRWWNGPRTSKWLRDVAGVIDMSANATIWHVDRLNSFKKSYDIDSFHFSGGEVASLPAHPTFDGEFFDPSDYTKRNAELSSSFGSMISIQSAYKSQHLPLLIRLSDGTSTWNQTGGLGTIIPTVLTMGLIGYPFFIPDAIGGSAYEEMPSRELYVRWLQLSAFLPIIHFSIPPYYYDDEMVTFAKEMVALHKNLVVPEVTRVMDEAVDSMTPIIRPIWWNAPSDEEALRSSTEFLVGDNILVAPIVVEGARQRDIYLPEGIWEDGLKYNVVYAGRRWLRNYNVSLEKVPYFIRVGLHPIAD